ncbi:MAG: 2-oxoacid:acceptor oxidoreductase family protein, partial [Clostridia bacterium]|nr:2-oxoacid:acceptor oxidoreductase family protein [Clostridia bacterium]
VGSPIVTKPDVLVAMNLPSLKKYENEVVSGGTIIIDSTLIAEKVQRDDVEVYYVPATKMAADEGFSTLANMILMGKLMKVCENVGYDMVEDAVKKVVPPRKANLIDVNLKAVKLGYEF